MSAPHPLPDGGGNPNLEADGFTVPSRRSATSRVGPKRYAVALQPSMEKRIRPLANDAGMSVSGWCRAALEAAIVDAEVEK